MQDEFRCTQHYKLVILYKALTLFERHELSPEFDITAASKMKEDIAKAIDAIHSDWKERSSYNGSKEDE